MLFAAALRNCRAVTSLGQRPPTKKEGYPLQDRWHPPGWLKRPVRDALASRGFELVRLIRPETMFIQRLLRDYQIDTLIDVGANRGQYALRLRRLGFSGEIHSFEPGRDAYEGLRAAAAGDVHWTCHNLALGSSPSSMKLRVSLDSVSSSLLEVAPAHVQAAPKSVVGHLEEVPVATLDSLRPSINGNALWLKLDTQGFEDAVLKGAEQTLQDVQVMQTELSLLPCYDGQSEYRAVLDHLHDRGFRIIYVEPGTQMHDSGEMLQFDALLSRPL